MKYEGFKMEKVGMLLDLEEIRQLRRVYSYGLDSCNVDVLDRVFSHDAHVVMANASMNGIAEIKAGLRQALHLVDRDSQPYSPFMHAITNHEITLTGDERASGTCYLIDFGTVSRMHSDPILLPGVYRDEYAVVHGRWRIVSSVLDVVWSRRPSSMVDSTHAY